MIVTVSAAAAQVYDSTKQLRYGHLMIMTDQDHDGSHIKGLIMNFLHHFYPSLLKVNSFLLEFITPIVKVQNGLTASFTALSLVSLPHHARAGVKCISNWSRRASCRLLVLLRRSGESWQKWHN